ncbi:hypothetical protein [Actinacidiphila bryophytorum]|uniref:hypothetical protein n=1 Tax=Actinacidiphila bryophytorum TaxID=1436133 RepID=UPI002176CDEE|nr:hypothetical protein [Actinacidiphila bryophytorum]UWE08882.1 hypothetical protein NYE86_09205 [Actinacidiphila bryophytorum]
MQLLGLPGAEPVEGGGLVEGALGVVGQQQGERGVEGAAAVLLGGEGAEVVAQFVDALLALRCPVLEGGEVGAQPGGALLGRVVALGGLLGLLVERVEPGRGVLARGRRGVGRGGLGGAAGQCGGRRGCRGQHGDPGGADGEARLRCTSMGCHSRRQ